MGGSWRYLATAQCDPLTSVPMAQEGTLRAWLCRADPARFALFAGAAAFTAYFCMYAFRKPFAAGTYAGETFGGMSLKDALVISQVIGYALSKWLGVKFLSELSPSRRVLALLALIGWAEAALLIFGAVPAPYQVVAIFFNGLPLGAVWGLVFGFLEGRRTSELLGAALSCSYILASGAVKSVGKGLMVHAGVPEPWMPSVTGLVFLPIFLLAVWALAQLPPPLPEDEEARSARKPMYAAERWSLLRKFFGGLLALIALYVGLTAFRDFRDNYAAEVWEQLGHGDAAHIFTLSEIPIAFGVMAVLALIYFIKDNRAGLFAAHAMMFAGAAIIGLSTLLFDVGALGGVGWMIGIGIGLYLAYVPFGCVLFDRMFAATGTVGTAVFLIYLADASGYAGSVGLVLYKHFGHAEMSKLAFLRASGYVVAVVAMAGFAYSAWYFRGRAASQLSVSASEAQT